MVVDVRATIVSPNHALAQITGYDQSELIGAVETLTDITELIEKDNQIETFRWCIPEPGRSVRGGQRVITATSRLPDAFWGFRGSRFGTACTAMGSGDTPRWMRSRGFFMAMEQHGIKIAYISIKSYLQFGLDHVNQSHHGLVDARAIQNIPRSFSILPDCLFINPHLSL
jgi:PAS domain-containing protein